MFFIKELCDQALEPYGSGCDKYECSKDQAEEGKKQSRTKNKIQSCCPTNK